MLFDKLYLISDRNQCSNLFITLEEALKAGIKMIQLREKDLNLNELYKLAIKIRKLTIKYKAKLFINSHIDIALEVNADGIHLSKNGLSIESVKNFIYKYNKKLQIIYSAHSLEESVEVEKKGVNAITFSPIFYTSSKFKYGKPKGIKLLKKVVSKLNIPVFALGGIKLHNLNELFKSGIYGVALISEIFQADFVYDKSKQLIETIKKIQNLPRAGFEPAQNFFY